MICPPPVPPPVPPSLHTHSTVIHERGSPETLRDPRGFAVKFYTREGNFDMVGNNMPVSGWAWGLGAGRLGRGRGRLGRVAGGLYVRTGWVGWMGGWVMPANGSCWQGDFVGGFRLENSLLPLFHCTI
jgi:hypothetical protein